MGYELVREMRLRQLPPNEKAVWLALGDHAREDGTNSWPSQETLCIETGYSERALRDILRLLEQRGAIVEMRPPGRRTSRKYRIVIDAVPIDPRALRPEGRAGLNDESRPAEIAALNDLRPAVSAALDSVKTGSFRRQDRQISPVRPADSAGKLLKNPHEPSVGLIALPSGSADKPAAKRPGDPRIKTLIEKFSALYKAEVGHEYRPTWGKDGALIGELLRSGLDPPAIEAVMALYFNDDFARRTGFDVGRFRASYNRLVSANRGNGNGRSTRIRPQAGKYDRFE